MAALGRLYKDRRFGGGQMLEICREVRNSEWLEDGVEVNPGECED